MDYRNLKGISKSGLNALWQGVPSFKAYLKNESNPFPPEHFVFGQLVEDLVVGIDLDSKYIVAEIEKPSDDTLDGKIFNALLDLNQSWSDISDETKIQITQDVGMNKRYTEDTRLKKVNALEESFTTYKSVLESNKIVISQDLLNRATETSNMLKLSKFRDLLQYTEAKLALSRVEMDVTIKGELDWIIINEESKSIQIVDLKTFGDKASWYGWFNQCKKYGYFEQAYNYTRLVEENYKGYTVSFIFLVVDKYNTIFTHTMTQRELFAGKYGYSFVDGEIMQKREDNKYPGFNQKLDLYIWYLEKYGEDVDAWPDAHFSLIKNNFNFYDLL